MAPALWSIPIKEFNEISTEKNDSGLFEETHNNFIHQNHPKSNQIMQIATGFHNMNWEHHRPT